MASASPKISTPLSKLQKSVLQLASEVGDPQAAADELRKIALELAPPRKRILSTDTTISQEEENAARASAVRKARQAFADAKPFGAQKRSPCLFDPADSKRMAWDIFVIIPMLVYLTMMMPYQMCFAAEPRGAIRTLEDAMDAIFIFDIFVNFRTAYVEDHSGEVVWDDWLVAKHYLKGWFFLDTISAIPFHRLEFLLQGVALANLRGLKILKSGRVIKAVKLLRFMKLSRLVKGSKIFMSIDPEVVDRFEDLFADRAIKTLLRMLRIVIVMGSICHIMACLWVLVGRLAVMDGHESWLDHDVVIQARLTNGTSFEPSDTSGGRQSGTIYLAAYYFCFTTMTTVGYGDIYPYNNSERIMCICLQASGAFVAAWVIASLTSIATQEDANAAFVSERMDAVSSYNQKLEVPPDLARRIRRHFRNFFAQKSSLDESQILHDLSTSLRGELSEYLVERGAMSEVTIFRNMDQVYWSKVLPLLRPAVYGRDEIITVQGEVCVDTFIITDGFASGCTIENLALQPPGEEENAAETKSQMESRNGTRSFVNDSGMVVVDIDDDAIDEGEDEGGNRDLANSRIDGYNFEESDEHKNGRRSYREESKVIMRALQLREEFHRFVNQNSGLMSSLGSRRGSVRRDANTPQGSATVSSFEQSGVLSQARRLEEDFQLRVASREEQGWCKTHLRALGPGATVDVLCCLHISQTSLETVKTTERTTCYAIDAEDFFKTFKDNESVFRNMQEHTVETQFKMCISNPSAPSPECFGTPLFMYSCDVLDARERDFLRRKRRKEAKEKMERERAMQWNAEKRKGNTSQNNTGNFKLKPKQ